MMLDPSIREPLVAAIPKLRAFAISLCRDRERAEDLVQGALLRACTNIGSFVPGSNMDAWLCAILRNHFYSEYRRQRRASRAVDSRTDMEAASLCGCPVGTVKSRVNRARSELARMLSIDGPEDFEADAVFSAAIASADRVPAQA